MEFGWMDNAGLLEMLDLDALEDLEDDDAVDGEDF
jgi:hypothetical protein